MTERTAGADERYMRRAIELAKRGRGYTNPNPIVGAVIVRDGRVIGEGYHARCGELHAERNALAACSEDPAGADLYVTLEPCCHTGRTPPCTEAIIAARMGRVFVGSADPNPKVAGGGVRQLRDAGITVVENVLRRECDALNTVFFHYIRSGRPYLTLKYAMTADGKIATCSGLSKWITGEEARRDVHLLRHENAVILAGIGTVLADDPLLNCRLAHPIPGRDEPGLDPVRVICDSRLRIPLAAQIVRTAGEIRTIIATVDPQVSGSVSATVDPAASAAAAIDDAAAPADAPADRAAKARQLKEAGCEVLALPAADDGEVDLAALLQRLGGEQLDSVLLEGGGTLAWSAVRAGLVDRVIAYTAPKIFGGAEAPTPVRGEGFDRPDQGLRMQVRSVRQLGADIRTEYEVMR